MAKRLRKVVPADIYAIKDYRDLIKSIKDGTFKPPASNVPIFNFNPLGGPSAAQTS